MEPKPPPADQGDKYHDGVNIDAIPKRIIHVPEGTRTTNAGLSEKRLSGREDLVGRPAYPGATQAGRSAQLKLRSGSEKV